MTGKKQENEQEQLAVAVSAASVASAGTSKKPPPRFFDNTPLDEVVFRPNGGSVEGEAQVAAGRVDGTGKVMIRAISILAAVAALAVSAAPASANDQWRKALPKPAGLGVTDFKGELVGIEP